MRHLYLCTLLIIVCCLSVSAQNKFPTSGAVGIGTTEPSALLHVNNGNIRLTNPSVYPYGVNIDLSLTGNWAREFSFSANSNGKLFSLGALSDSAGFIYGYIGGNTVENTAYRTPWMVFKSNGYIGINNKTPNAQLEISGGPVWTSNGWTKSLKLQNGAAVELAGSKRTFGLGTSGDKLYLFNIQPDGNAAAQYFLVADGNTGNVTIGNVNTDYNGNNYKLAVDGAIGTRKIRVQQGAWSDFVFHDNYDLPKLSAVEKYIREHKHLEGIPSENEVKKDGIDVGEMNKLLLQKIEELTLHIIELNKRLEKVEAKQL
ncbi:hypothetical protein KTO58_02495 [Chitinophaga pendula]|uniref:hypothetical protein n=1 Tax=Chitinophaga TaxID=79328 RepID=UPI000BB0149A|nr:MULTISPECIES: hypothetical protein [Chitinophaga]ASZ14284.1 hypothetical protein CK934_26725 [Chitinophaga sp. MD30]UCJ08069.1 hypothetical protein KTO58_02495 [Chitinophaga pendula]